MYHRWVGLLVILAWPNLPTAQTLSALESQLAHTQSQLVAIQKKLVQAAHTSKKVQAQAAASTVALIKAQAYPQALWDIHSLANNHTGGGLLLAHAATQQATQLAALQQKHQTLFRLYQAAQQEQAKLENLRAQIAQAEGRRGHSERTELAHAGREASALAAKLTAALGDTTANPSTLPEPLFAVTSPPVAPPVALPIASPTALPAVAVSPRQPPLKGRVVVGFRAGEGAEREGVVLAAPAGSVVRSPVAGEVLFAGGFRQFGGLVIVQGADGHDELLGGLGALNVLAGQKIKANQPLGELGPRGRLYWEVRVRNVVRNPLTLK